jgi:hypothetical protein
MPGGMARTRGRPPPRREAAKAPRKIGLRTAVTGLVLLAVTITALLIHLSWSYAARRNVSDVAGQLNRQIVGSVQHEMRGILKDAVAAHGRGSKGVRASQHENLL